MGEDNESIVVRFYNPTDKKVKGDFWSRYPVKSAALLKLSEEFLEDVPVKDGSSIVLNVPAKKIITLSLKY
jgi:hypothetical protein